MSPFLAVHLLGNWAFNDCHKTLLKCESVLCWWHKFSASLKLQYSLACLNTHYCSLVYL
jgi:hypothetical protein